MNGTGHESENRRNASTTAIRRRVSLVIAGLLTGGAGACTDVAVHDDYGFAILVESDPGMPLPGAVVSFAGKALASSDAHGRMLVHVNGAEGDVRSFQVACPEGHREPGAPLSVVLRRLADEGRVPEYVVACPPTERTVVVAVRADKGPNLSVRYLGREVARTDKSGIAHISLKSAPEDTVEITLDTSDSPRLRPRNPSTRFRVGQADELFVYNQSFQVETPRGGVARAPRGPILISSRRRGS